MKWIAFLLVLCVQSYALAWSGIAHQIVAVIAEDHLTPKAKAEIQKLLGEANISDAEIASWADEMRTHERPESRLWHYVNIPHDATGFDRARDGSDNIVGAIEQRGEILANRQAPIEQRRDALKFIVHFLGDIHQPMHCVERKGDHGSNSRLVLCKLQFVRVV